MVKFVLNVWFRNWKKWFGGINPYDPIILDIGPKRRNTV